MSTKRKRTDKKKKCDFILNNSSTIRTTRDRSRANTRNWCQLPEDLLLEVIKYLTSSDEICFRGVCPSWRRLPYINGDGDGLPLVVSTKSKQAKRSCKVQFKLFHPLQQKPYFIDDISSRITYKDGVNCLAAKKGWLFLALSPRPRGIISFVMFSPFNKHIIKLPNLDCKAISLKTKPEDCRGTFSSDPLTATCEYFVVHPSSDDTRSTISTYCPGAGDTTWTTRRFPNLRHDLDDVEFAGGSCYCVSSIGILVKCNPVADEFYFLVFPMGTWMYSPRLVCYEGCVYIVSRRYIGGFQGTGFRVTRVNFLTNHWCHMARLPNLCLFLGSTSFILPAIGARSNFADKIFFHDQRDGNVRFYSFEDGKIHSYEGDTPYKGWRCKKKHDPIWLQPPQLPH